MRRLPKLLNPSLYDYWPDLRRWWYTRRGNTFSIWTEGENRVLMLKLEESQLRAECWERPKRAIHYTDWLKFKSWWNGAEWLPYEATANKDNVQGELPI